MKGILFSLFVTMFLNSQAIASDYVELNSLRFTNRAQCAVDANAPTNSAFILINNMDTAKAIYRLAKFRGENSSEMTKMGIKVYRYSVIQLLSLIHRKLMNRELPLLPHDTSSESELHVPSKYKALMRSCRSDEYCEGLDDYIANIWKIASSKSSNAGKVVKYYTVDNYHSKDSYVQDKVFEKGMKRSGMNCHYLKKFSPLQAQLYGTKPTQEVLTKIAQAALESEEYLSSCEDFSQQKNLQVAAYQIEIPHLKEKKWNNKGFDYWNSLKLYFSWAFRNAPEMQEMAAPFADLFRGVAVEDSVMIVPNGCKSITTPKCDGNYLSQNALREFAKEDFKRKALSLDVLSEVPDGPQSDLMNDPFTEVNTDILDLATERSAEEWLNRFRKNFSGARNIMKSKLILAMSTLNVVTSKVSSEKMLDLLGQQFAEIDNLSGNSEEVLKVKNDLYYLCSESTFVGHKEFSFLKGKLEILRKTTLVDGIAGQLSKTKTAELFSFYEKLIEKITTSCGALQQKKIWDDNFTLDRTGFFPWYMDKIYSNKVESTAKDKMIAYLKNNSPLLSYSSYKTSKKFEDVICTSASDCSRKVIQSIIDLYAVSQYASTFWSLEQKIKSPNIFNPYAERTTCKVYDPWFKTKSMIFNLFMDMGQAALSLTTPGAIFGRLDLEPGRVTSFRQLVSEGKIEYDVRMKPQKIRAGLVADFGPLLGVPCTVSMTGSEYNPYNYVRFSGISVGACNSEADHDLNVRTASDMDDNATNAHSECLSCTLNFESAAGALTSVASATGPTFFLVRGLVRLYRALKDPHNIPRNWNTNPNHVIETYKRFGEIPKKCVRSLRKGKRCLANSCEERVADKITDLVSGQILSLKVPRHGKGQVKVSTCSEPIKFSVYRSTTGNSGHSQNNRDCRVSKVKIPSSCQGIKR